MKDALKTVNNPKAAPEKRAKALLSLMTLEEKTGQLNQRLYGFNIYKREGSNITLTKEFKEEVARFGGIGTLYGLYRADPWADKNEETGINGTMVKKAYNTVQKYVIENSRLHIPMMVSTECPHGHQALFGTLLPVNLAVGASFDPELLKKAYKECGKELKKANVDLALMSVLDVLRDPRWGRSEECYSEDPYLSSKLAYAAISGMESSGVGAVAKHLCGQGQTTGGTNASAAGIGKRELREIHLPSIKAAVKAGTSGVMAAYNEIDGIYCHANKELLTDILRNEYGFKGFVMADGCALDALNTVTGDSCKSGAAALKAGVDISLWDRAFTLLPEAVKRGLIKEKDLDRAVLRVLTFKFAKGLFEHPYIDEEYKEETKSKEMSAALAGETVVLLKNNGVLPVKKAGKILVTGPNACDIYRQLGDYTPPVKAEKAFTLLDGIKACCGKETEVICLPGSGLFETNDEMLKEAAEAAKKCDLVIACVGTSSSRYESAVFDKNGAALKEDKITMDCGEGRDVSEVRLSKAQERLIEALSSTGTKLVTVVISG
ncbi:MAG: glycoside hydrolase family 3 protein, partial [Lachnospiraceae bacterium]|nr:glycoside hydrolase family 3 protein [Lachnospiraceae bacterium]